jgi:ribosomal protein S15P/S13E
VFSAEADVAGFAMGYEPDPGFDLTEQQSGVDVGVAVPGPEVEAGAANYGVVPVENSTEGVVNHTLDNFIGSNLKICGEVELRIHHNLLVSDVTNVNSISRIYSHAQSLAQSRKDRIGSRTLSRQLSAIRSLFRHLERSGVLANPALSLLTGYRAGAKGALSGFRHELKDSGLAQPQQAG